jgi:hypothetical protein
VVENEPVEPWLAHLRRTGGDLMAELDDQAASPELGAAEASAPREEASVFDLESAPQQARPQEVGPVAWAAANHPGEATRHTAALALTALPPVPDAGLERIDGALEGLKGPWKRFTRQAELRGALADADPLVGQANADLPPWDRLGIWFWRFWRRVVDDRDRIIAVTLGTAAGAALALGLLRALVAFPTHQMVGLSFAWYSYIAFILGGALGLALALVHPLLLAPRDRRVAAALLGVILGTLFFGIAHFLVMLLFQFDPDIEAYRLGTGTLAGFGLALALYGLGYRYRRTGTGSWLLRAGTALAFLALAQFLAMSSASSWQDRKFQASAEFSVGPSFYQNNLNPLDWFRALDDWVQARSAFYGGDLLALLDAATVGVVLALGMILGLVVADRLLDRYRALVRRVDE